MVSEGAVAVTDKDIYDALVALVKREIPGFEPAYKNESRLQKAVGLLVTSFCPTYMTDFISTIYPKVYYPDRAFETSTPGDAWKVLAHEYVHLWDQKQRRVGFPLAYSFPQVFVLLSLIAVLAFWWKPALGFIVFLAALAPWPAPGRTHAEMRGYAMSMAVDYWRYGSVQKGTKEWISSMFTGWNYYRMNPNKDDVLRQLDSWEAGLMNGLVIRSVNGKPFADVYEMLKKLDVVRSA